MGAGVRGTPNGVATKDGDILALTSTQRLEIAFGGRQVAIKWPGERGKVLGYSSLDRHCESVAVIVQEETKTLE
jgi:hypothetical protein